MSYDPTVSGLSAPPPDELSEVKLAYQSGQHPELRRAGNGEQHAPLPGGRASRRLRVSDLHRRPDIYLGRHSRQPRRSMCCSSILCRHGRKESSFAADRAR